MLDEISSIKESVIKNHGYNSYQGFNIPDETNMTDEELEEQVKKIEETIIAPNLKIGYDTLKENYENFQKMLEILELN